MPLIVGQNIDGNIVKTGAIGDPSAFGLIYEVESTKHNSILILKLFNRVGDKISESRFRQECQILHDLSPHDHIISPFDGVVVNGQNIYYLMEKADYSLYKYHDQNKILDLAEIKRFFIEICEGLEHTHRKNKVHRDLHWKNVLLKTINGTHKVKITDFGMAKDFNLPDISNLPASIWGLITVTPPEIHFRIYDNPQIVDYKPADIYALGILLHFLFQWTPEAFGIQCWASCMTYLQQNQIDKITADGITRKNAYQNWLTSLTQNYYDMIIVNRLNDFNLMNKVNQIIIKLCHADYTKRYSKISDLITDINNL